MRTLYCQVPRYISCIASRWPCSSLIGHTQSQGLRFRHFVCRFVVVSYVFLCIHAELPLLRRLIITFFVRKHSHAMELEEAL